MALSGLKPPTQLHLEDNIAINWITWLHAYELYATAASVITKSEFCNYSSLHRDLRMLVGDVLQTFSPPSEPACGDQWHVPNYVSTAIAELEWLDITIVQYAP